MVALKHLEQRFLLSFLLFVMGPSTRKLEGLPPGLEGLWTTLEPIDGRPHA